MPQNAGMPRGVWNEDRSMTKKWKLSKCKAIIMNKHGYVLGMSNIVVEPKRKKRIGHARYMYLTQFDYDKFLTNGYAVDQNEYYVFKLNKNLSGTVTRVLGDDGFKKFVATSLSGADWLGALGKKNGRLFEIMRLFNMAIQLSEREIDRIQQKNGGIACMLNFKISDC